MNYLTHLKTITNKIELHKMDTLSFVFFLFLLYLHSSHNKVCCGLVQPDDVGCTLLKLKQVQTLKDEKYPYVQKFYGFTQTFHVYYPKTKTVRNFDMKELLYSKCYYYFDYYL